MLLPILTYSRTMPEPVSFLLRNLSPNLQAISAWHASMIIDSKSKSVQTLPVWLQDVLVNRLSFWQSGLYLCDGRWRQFECLDCFDIDSVHNDFQRGILYVLFYPDLVENVMCAWAKYQGDNGHIVETLAAGCYSPTRKIDWCVYVAWENSRYFTTQPMFSPQNDAWGGNEPRNFKPMTCHYPDLGSASNWVGNLLYPIRRRTTTQIWLLTRHQYGISALISQASFCKETSGGVSKYRLFSQVSLYFPDLFAFSALTPRDSKTSATPAIALTLRIHNPTTKSDQVSHSLFPPNRTISHSSLDYNLLLTFEWLSVFVVMVCTRKNWMILLVLVNWNAWLDGNKPLKLKFLIYSPLEQPLNLTSNNNRDRMVKVLPKVYGRNKSCCKFIMVAYGKVKIENRLFQHLF